MADLGLTRGSVATGCFLGCACQIPFILLGLLALTQSNHELLLASWGVTQWIALIPLIVRQRAKGHVATAKGLLIMGCIGVLLSSACAAFFVSPFAGKRAG